MISATGKGHPIALLGLLGFAPYAHRLLGIWWSNFNLASLEPLMPGILVLPLAVLLLAVRLPGLRRRDAGGPLGGPAEAPAVPGSEVRQPRAVGKSAARRHLPAVVSLGAGGLAGLLALAGWPLLGAPLLPVAVAAVWAELRGADAVRLRAIPIAMLALLPPLPLELLTRVQPPLTLLGARIATAIGTLAGVEPVRTGNLVQTEHFYIQVVDACSGLYMCLMFLIISMTLAHLRGWRPGRVALALGLSVPLGLLLNGFRLSFLLLLGYRWPEVEHSTMAHDLPGLVLFVIGLLLLFVAGEGWARRRPAALPEPAAGARP